MPSIDYYQTLKIKPNASQQTVKKAFRKLALEFHPDRNPNNHQSRLIFSQIQKAYEILSDENKKKRYDQLRKLGFARNATIPKVVDRNRVRISIKQPVITMGDSFKVDILFYDIGTGFRLEGMHQFYVLNDPVVTSFESGENAPKLIVSYILQPKELGYITVGPASFIQNGVKVLSEKVHIKVNIPADEIVVRPFSRPEKILYSLVTALIIFYLVLISYNIYKYGLGKPQRGQQLYELLQLPTK